MTTLGGRDISDLVREVARVKNMLDAVCSVVDKDTTVDELLHLAREAQAMLGAALALAPADGPNLAPVLGLHTVAEQLGATPMQVRRAIYTKRIRAIHDPATGWWRIAASEIERCKTDRSWLHLVGRPKGSTKIKADQT